MIISKILECPQCAKEGLKIPLEQGDNFTTCSLCGTEFNVN